jgi:hypothetical protein
VESCDGKVGEGDAAIENHLPKAAPQANLHQAVAPPRSPLHRRLTFIAIRSTETGSCTAPIGARRLAPAGCRNSNATVTPLVSHRRDPTEADDTTSSRASARAIVSMPPTG